VAPNVVSPPSAPTRSAILHERCRTWRAVVFDSQSHVAVERDAHIGGAAPYGVGDRLARRGVECGLDRCVESLGENRRELNRRCLREVNVEPSTACGGPNANPAADGCFGPSWLPDGEQIVFAKGQNGDVDANIYTVNADGTGLMQVTHTGGSQSPDWGVHPLAQ
jgi:hypothetical protein